jgi:hypothetical protein
VAAAATPGEWITDGLAVDVAILAIPVCLSTNSVGAGPRIGEEPRAAPRSSLSTHSVIRDKSFHFRIPKKITSTG